MPGHAGKEQDEDESKEDELMSLTLAELEVKKARADEHRREDFLRADKIKGVIVKKKLEEEEEGAASTDQLSAVCRGRAVALRGATLSAVLH